MGQSCASCGSANAVRALFCAQCGASLKARPASRATAKRSRAIPVAALAAKLDARVAAKEAIQMALNEREDLAIGDELTIQGLRIKITRVPRKDPVVTGRYVIVSDERDSP